MINFRNRRKASVVGLKVTGRIGVKGWRGRQEPDHIGLIKV